MPHLTIRRQARLLFAGAFCLLFFSWPALAAEGEAGSDQDAGAVSLESEVMLPPELWPDAAPLARDESTAGAEPRAAPPAQSEPVPSATLALPPPLDPPPLTEVTVMLDWYLSPQHAMLLIAQARELFKAQGLAVELLSPADPTIPLKLLVAEEVDLALTRQPILHLQAHQGEPLTRVGTLIETPLNAVIVTGSVAETDDVALLAGRDYGFSTREGETIVAERLIPQSLRQTDGFKAPVNVHFDAAAAVVRGDANVIADGYFASLPQQLAPEGIESHVIRFEEIDIPRHDGVIVVANSQTLGRHGATWARFMSAVEQASHWMIENPEASWTLVAEQHPILDNAINEANWESLLRRLSLSPAAVNTRRYQAFETYLQKRGLIEETLPVSRLAVDPHTLGAEP
ncbi:ABC transporter substrate-binding protein [Halomonas sp. PAMB 3232]|uniref:ABC transporter substrate-binding protein n=1 Tax=Halomonas sp. PAMB 3232 TaxID=3075221 RepID=UPI00289D7E1E|nr:ABC transporter substrate-binding protein [Halomonas sp. PAMB 3232]WNL40472.1 ABC transporter substrate-binding protein [Halomonas sp. PAMB 3232]